MELSNKLNDIELLSKKLNSIVNFIDRIDNLHIDKILYVLIALLAIMILLSTLTLVIVIFKVKRNNSSIV